MRIPDIVARTARRPRMLLLAATAVLATGLIAHLVFRAQQGSGSGAEAGAEAWALPALSNTSDVQQQLLILRGRNLWGEAAEAADAQPVTAPSAAPEAAAARDWELVGIVRQGGKLEAEFWSPSALSLEIFSVDQELYPGTFLHEIHSGHVVLRHGDDRSTHYLYE